MKNLKQRIKNGDTLVGCWLNLGSSVSAEIVGLAGFDWVLLDLEHGAGDEKDLLYQLQALEHGTAAAIIRVESYERQRIHRVLDLGAGGVMVPRITSADEALQAAKGLKYQPEGVRGVAFAVRASRFGNDFDNYYRFAQENLVGVIQIETLESLEYLDEIAAVDGVDVLFVGPADLSMALGVFGQLEHPKFVEALEAIKDAANRAGKMPGILMRHPDDFEKFYQLGFRFMACGADSAFVNTAARNMTQTLQEKRSAAETG